VQKHISVESDRVAGMSLYSVEWLNFDVTALMMMMMMVVVTAAVAVIRMLIVLVGWKRLVRRPRRCCRVCKHSVGNEGVELYRRRDTELEPRSCLRLAPGKYRIPRYVCAM